MHIFTEYFIFIPRLKKKESSEEAMFCKILVLEFSSEIGILDAMVGPIFEKKKLSSSLEVSL